MEKSTDAVTTIIKTILIANTEGYIPVDLLVNHWLVSTIASYQSPQDIVESVGYKIRLDVLDIIYDEKEDIVTISNTQNENYTYNLWDAISRQIVLAVGQANMILRFNRKKCVAEKFNVFSEEERG